MQSTYENLAPRALRTSPSAWLSDPVSTLRAAASAVGCFLEGFSQRKAADEILELSRSLQSTSPKMATQMRRAATRSWD